MSTNLGEINVYWDEAKEVVSMSAEDWDKILQFIKEHTENVIEIDKFQGES